MDNKPNKGIGQYLIPIFLIIIPFSLYRWGVSLEALYMAMGMTSMGIGGVLLCAAYRNKP